MTRSAALLVLAFLTTAAPAQVTYPPRSEQSDVHLRYRIRADRDERIRQFRAMTTRLHQLGFVAAPREDADLDIFDPTAELLTGTIPTTGAFQLLGDPRIQTVVALPAGQALPDGGMVPVRVWLTTGFATEQQRQFHEQTTRHLRFLGFQESMAYDHRGYTVVRGSMPSANVLTLRYDLRYQPTGWFLSAVPRDVLPPLFRQVLPVRYVEVLPSAPAAAPPEPPAVPPAPAMDPATAPPAAILAKLTTDVRQRLDNAMTQANPLRVDVILHAAPEPYWDAVRLRIQTAADGLDVEGRVGVVVSVRLAKATDVLKVAALEDVRAIRLPPAATETARPTVADAAGGVKIGDHLTATRVADLHRLGYRGDRQQIVVIASEFPGIDALRGKYVLAGTRLLDLTAELSSEIRPAPPSESRPGVGTVAAAVAQSAAPGATLTLVRVDPTAFHQLLTVARAVAGEVRYSEGLQSRAAELSKRGELLSIRRNQVTGEYQRAFSDLGDEPALVKRRAEAEAAVVRLVADEAAFEQATRRFTLLKAGLDSLRGTAVVVNTLVWDSGWPQDGLDELSRYLGTAFTPKPVRSALEAYKLPPVPTWVQPASPAIGQVWAGPFLDADHNGVLEFATESSPLPAGRWTRELNFLGFEPIGGKVAAVLPAGLKLRLTVQWREPHDPEGFLPEEPVFPFTLRLLRQVDPEGKTAATDEFVEVGQSAGPSVRLLKTAASGAYEHTMLVTVPTEGVYSLRVEGGAAFEYQLPALRQKVEVTPRILIEAADDATAAKGRAVFRTFARVNAGVGIPGGSPAAVTVGVTSPDGSSQTLTGAGPGVTLRVKPDLLTAGTLDVGGMMAQGPAVAAAYAGGTGASLLSAGVRASDLTRSVGLTPGAPLVIPQPLFDHLSPRVRR